MRALPLLATTQTCFYWYRPTHDCWSFCLLFWSRKQHPFFNFLSFRSSYNTNNTSQRDSQCQDYNNPITIEFPISRAAQRKRTKDNINRNSGCAAVESQESEAAFGVVAVPGYIGNSRRFLNAQKHKSNCKGPTNRPMVYRFGFL
ncbi:hypothetical protein H2248_003968 [Termitomyces sp. 'cryptogamus']|nr:hypothetical protein H2248_003968 [Termitomyces sp. 'cryptogamus']